MNPERVIEVKGAGKWVDIDHPSTNSSFFNHTRAEGAEPDFGLSSHQAEAFKEQNETSVRDLFSRLGNVLAETTTGHLILIMWIFFVLQYVVFPAVYIVGQKLSFVPATNPVFNSLWASIFTIRGNHLEYIWTWVFSVFSHGSLLHIFVNSFVFLSFGLPIEKKLERKEYISFFIITGVIAGIAQAVSSAIAGAGYVPILGASASIAGIIGLVAIHKPNEKLLFLFIIPMKIWVGILAFISLSVGLLLIDGFGAFGVAHIAHLTGLGLGLAYGIVKFGIPREIWTAR